MPKKPAPRKKLTRQEQRDLDIEIGFLEGVVQRDPDYIDALQVLGDDYTRRGRFASGLEVDRALSRLRPEDSLVFYNLACSYSLTKQVEKSAEALEQALKLGYRDFKWISEDPDLSHLRKSDFYQKIRSKVRALKIKIA